MTIELQRTEEQFLTRQADALDRELDRAAAGLPPPTVSTRAAARYLGVHFDTLGEWRRRSPPLGPPFQKGAGLVGAGLNQHVKYLYGDLVAWQEARRGKTPKERRLQTELDQAQQRAREFELELALRQAKDEVARLQKKLGRISHLATLRDVAMAPHDWALVGNRIAGHVLVVDDVVLAQALDGGDVWEGTLEEALAQPWTSTEARQAYQDAFVAVLTGTQHLIEAARSRQHASDLEERLDSATHEAKPVRPFEKRKWSALSTRDPDILGGRPGRPSKEPKPLALTAAEDEEFSRAKSGKLEWVGPGVAAYMLGISKDALKKRRQRNEGLIPEHKPVKNNRQGAQYRWSSVRRCAGAERISSDVLAQRLGDVVAALKKLGLEGLEQDLPWAYNDVDRLVGFASLHPQLPARALTVIEALDAPWVSSEARQPFHDWAIGVLDSAAESAAKAAD